jgi:hypothetical protein
MPAVLNYPAVSISDMLKRFEEQVTKTASKDALVKLFCSQIIPFISNHPVLDPLRSRWIVKQQTLAYDVDRSEQDTLEEIRSFIKKTQKLPQNEKEQALKAYQSYEKRVKEGKYYEKEA